MKLGILYTTIDSLEAARELATSLVERRLAACVNFVPGMHAIHAWGGEVHEDIEIAVFIKSRRELHAELIAFVEKTHPYDCPALLWLDVDQAGEAFGTWVLQMTKDA
jgi:periplasmic divalent cation tolerance protein